MSIHQTGKPEAKKHGHNTGRALLGIGLLSLAGCATQEKSQFVAVGPHYSGNIGNSERVLDSGTPQQVNEAVDGLIKVLGKNAFDKAAKLYTTTWQPDSHVVQRDFSNFSFNRETDKTVSAGQAYVASEWISMKSNVPGGFSAVISGLENLKDHKPALFNLVLSTMEKDPVNPLMGVGRHYAATVTGTYPSVADKLSYSNEPARFAWVRETPDRELWNLLEECK